MKRLFNKDVPFITYIIHDKNMKNGRTVTVYKPTQEYYILFELIKFRRLPATFPDIGITVISEGSEPSLSDVSMTRDVLIDIKTPSSIENNNPDYYKQELARIAEFSQAVGLITTLKPTMVMDAEHPLDMAKEAAEYVTVRIAELESEIVSLSNKANAKLQDLKAELAELRERTRWIPVSERLPEEKQSVLALDRTGTAYHWEYSKCLSNIFVGYYTHWMPLPKPPEVKE